MPRNYNTKAMMDNLTKIANYRKIKIDVKKMCNNCVKK